VRAAQQKVNPFFINGESGLLKSELKEKLAEKLGERIRFDVPMARHTYFRVGGPADAMAMPADIRELKDLVRMLEGAGVDWFVLGGGTNLLVKDKGIRGVVISLEKGFSGIETVESNTDRSLVHAGAGAGLSALCRYALENNLGGMNFAVGIPGTVGGAVVMNAGTGQGSMESVLAAIDVLKVPDETGTIPAESLSFRYRRLDWDSSMVEESGREPIVLAGWFGLSSADGRAQEAEARRIREFRRQSQPAGFSAGCAFKNPSPDMPAGRLIDQAGLKGMRIGDAQVSEIHANFIVNLGSADAADILRLMEKVREKVLMSHGVELEPEIVTVGES
ncbi:MAG: UDP-N-acetylmuramate dehydrogenase, partial [Desulfosalsimonas sp.]